MVRLWPGWCGFGGLCGRGLGREQSPPRGPQGVWIMIKSGQTEKGRSGKGEDNIERNNLGNGYRQSNVSGANNIDKIVESESKNKVNGRTVVYFTLYAILLYVINHSKNNAVIVNH